MNEEVLILSLAAPVLPPGRDLAWEFSGVSRFGRLFWGYAHEPHALRMLFFMRMEAPFYAHKRPVSMRMAVSAWRPGYAHGAGAMRMACGGEGGYALRLCA